MVFIFGSVYVMDYVYRFAYVESALWDDAYLIMINKLLVCCCSWFASILLKGFASMFIMDIGPNFSFLPASLPGFGIRVMLVS